MDRNTKLSLVLFLALISSSYCSWLLRTSAGTCGMAPYGVLAINGNCVLAGSGDYQKITCNGTDAVVYGCTDANCNSCKEKYTQELDTCSHGFITQCYRDQPSFPKYVGNRYITDSFFITPNCNDQPLEISAWARDTCVNIYGDSSYSMSCKDNLVTYYSYNTSTCAGGPTFQMPAGIQNQCALSHLQKCY